MDKNKRQQVAQQSGFSEIVFINNVSKGKISIFTPKREIPFAGHAIVGAAYFLNHKYRVSVNQIVSMDEIIDVWSENKLTWARGKLSILPCWNFEQLSNAASIDKISPEESVLKNHVMVWSWIDQGKGIIRARTFASDWGILEDEANGSGSMKLAAHLNRNLIVYHGKGSVIYTRASLSSTAEVGGLVRSG